MKKVIMMAVAAVFAVSVANAQGWFVSGTVGYNDVQDESTSFRIMPSLHKVLNDKWAVGIGLGYMETKPEGGDKRSMFGFEPSLIRTVRIADWFYYTPSVYVGVAFGKEGDAKATVIDGGIKPLSFELRPSSQWGFSFSAGDLSYTNTKPKDGDSTGEFNFDINSISNFETSVRFYF